MLSADEGAVETRAVEVEPCSSKVSEESHYPLEEPAQSSSYSSGTIDEESRYPKSQQTGRQTRSQTGNLPSDTSNKMSMAEEMNSKTV